MQVEAAVMQVDQLVNQKKSHPWYIQRVSSASVKDIWETTPATQVEDPRKGKHFCRHCGEEVRISVSENHGGKQIACDLLKPIRHKCIAGRGKSNYRPRHQD